jgi:protein arginine phosphatase
MTGATPGREVPEPFRILFVCSGNTCRSPMAEVLLRRALEARGWSQVEVRSAGVAADSGAPATDAAVRTAARHGLELTEHRSTPLDPPLMAWADLILTMTSAHLAAVTWAGGGGRSALITAFAAGEDGDPEQVAAGVADPFGGDDEEYEATFRELEELMEGVLTRLGPVLEP